MNAINPYTSETYRELNRKAGQRQLFVDLFDEIETNGPLTPSSILTFANNKKLFNSPAEVEIQRHKEFLLKNKNLL